MSGAAAKQDDNPHIETSVPVFQLQCETAFNGLTPKERLYAFHVGKAAWEGAKICLMQTSPEAPFIFELLQRLFAGCDDTDPGTPSPVLARLEETSVAAGVSAAAYKVRKMH